MASRYEGSDFPDPDPGEGSGQSDQFFSDWDRYLAEVTEAGDAAAFFADAVERNQGVSVSDQGRVLNGEDGEESFGSEDDTPADEARFQGVEDKGVAADGVDANDHREDDAHDAAPGGKPPRSPDDAIDALERTPEPRKPIDTLRERVQAQLDETASPVGEAATVNRISQRAEAIVVELLDVPHPAGADYAQALTDVSRFACGQGDLESVRAVQTMLGELPDPDSGSKPTEHTKNKAALATAYYHGLSLGDLESESKLHQLLEQEQRAVIEAGSYVKSPYVDGAAIARVCEECVRRGLPSDSYINRYVEGAEAQWSIKYVAFLNAAQGGNNETAATQFQAHIEELTQQQGLSDNFVRYCIPQVLSRAVEPRLKSSLLDRYHMVGTYRREQSYTNYRQLIEMAETIAADTAYMRAGPGRLYELNDHIQEIAGVHLHERGAADAVWRQRILKSSGELEVSAMVWNHSAPEAVSAAVEAHASRVQQVLETESKRREPEGASETIREVIRARIAKRAEAQANDMRAIAAVQYFRYGNLDASVLMSASISDPKKQFQSYYRVWAQADTEQINRMTPIELTVGVDHDPVLAELHETALVLASMNPDAIATRFEALHDAAHIAVEPGQPQDFRVSSQIAQMRDLLHRLTEVDPERAQAVARAYVPLQISSSWLGETMANVHYRALTTAGSADTYLEVAKHISREPYVTRAQKAKKLAKYALKLQEISKTLAAFELPD